MDAVQAFWLALIQGLTEFLPISSAGHLILVPRLLGWPDQGLAFDVAVHVGSLVAVVTYFRHDLADLLGAWLRSLGGGALTAQSRLAWAVLWGTLPVALAGYLLNDLVDTTLRGPRTIALATIGFAFVLWWADRRGRRARTLDSVGWRDVAVVGLAQAIALIPGTSRSGITISAGLALGFSRREASRYSFLLSIPVIVLAGGYESVELAISAVPVDWTLFALGAAVSALSAYLCVALFLRVIERIGMLPFVLYRLALGALLLAWFG